MEAFYDSWSKEYHKTNLKEPENDVAWEEFFTPLQIERNKEKREMRALLSN